MAVHLTRADLVVVGSLSSDLAPVAADYERRIGRYTRFAVHEVKAEPTARGEALVLAAEEARLAAVLDRLVGPSSAGVRIVALDSRAAAPTSEDLVEQWLGASRLVLLIGGTMGLPPAIRARATSAVSFGRITMPHQLARVVATEQLYRAFRIARNEPYHF